MSYPNPNGVIFDAITKLHRKTDIGGGMTSGYCAECDVVWPCRTYHLAMGWGDTFDECWDEGWCRHVEERMR